MSDGPKLTSATNTIVPVIAPIAEKPKITGSMFQCNDRQFCTPDCKLTQYWEPSAKSEASEPLLQNAHERCTFICRPDKGGIPSDGGGSHDHNGFGTHEHGEPSYTDEQVAFLEQRGYHCDRHHNQVLGGDRSAGGSTAGPQPIAPAATESEIVWLSIRRQRRPLGEGRDERKLSGAEQPCAGFTRSRGDPWHRPRYPFAVGHPGAMAAHPLTRAEVTELAGRLHGLLDMIAVGEVDRYHRHDVSVAGRGRGPGRRARA